MFTPISFVLRIMSLTEVLKIPDPYFSQMCNENSIALVQLLGSKLTVGDRTSCGMRWGLILQAQGCLLASVLVSTHLLLSETSGLSKLPVWISVVRCPDYK